MIYFSVSLHWETESSFTTFIHKEKKMKAKRSLVQTQEKPFPSDELLEILRQVQTRNVFATWEGDDIPNVLRRNISDAVYNSIRYTIKVVERNGKPDQDIDLSRNGSFYSTFGQKLLNEVTSIVGPMTSDEEVTVLKLLYIELLNICYKHAFYGVVNHKFTYVGSKRNGKFVIQHMM